MTSRFAIAIALAGCAAQRPPPKPPSPLVRGDLDRAETAEKARQHDVARAAYLQAIADAHDPASEGLARGDYGETLLTWGEIDEGARQLQRAVVAAPDQPSAWHDLGVAQHHQGNYVEAADAFEHAKRLEPRAVKTRLALAGVRWKIATTCFANHGADDVCAREVDATKAEYRAILGFDVPDRLRERVHWALDQLAKPHAGLREDALAPAPSPPALVPTS